jgi:uncharacterized membrane protein YeaQ/YmgE (transglycosylase-associated protein family)
MHGCWPQLCDHEEGEVGEMIGFLVAGLATGALARLLKSGPQSRSLPMALLIGMVGSTIGGLTANAVGTGDWFEFNALGLVIAVGSAVLLLGVSERAAPVR